MTYRMGFAPFVRPNDLEMAPLRSGHIQRKFYFIVCSSEKSADFSELLFHKRGRSKKMHLSDGVPSGENVFGSALRLCNNKSPGEAFKQASGLR